MWSEDRRLRPFRTQRHEQRFIQAFLTMAHQFGELPNGRLGKYLRHRHALAESFLDARHQHDHLQRVAAKIEEVVGDADRVNLEELFPNVDELLLQIILRSYVLSSESGE